MASPNFVMCGLLLVLVFFLTAAGSSGITPADLERLLMDLEDEPAPPVSTRPGPSNTNTNLAQILGHPVAQTTDTAAPQPMNLDGTWEDILHSQGAARPGPSNSHTDPAQNFHRPLSQIPDTATAQRVHLESAWQGILDVDQTAVVHQPYDLLAQHLGHDQTTEQEDASFLSSIGAPQYTSQSRIQMLNRAKSRIYEMVGVKIGPRSGANMPFKEPLSKSEFFHYAKNSETSNNRFGTWPFEISTAPDKTERFLVNQAHPQSEIFVKAHGLEAAPHYKTVYLDVWHEIQIKESIGVYGYIGTIRAPKQFSSLKAETLIPSAIKWQVVRPLSASVVLARLP
ncbi:uncharacterized protein UTRI_02779 [Ustilago trichophora]|uniref:Effector family protein Eff1 n=1 Tax=Ustilago trichophora TaxID=86804 RepID=A0A5C3EP45_9BASI|nr:uncharacterized protein UTRI_02779 [Ustilago trichophora]